MEKYNPHITVLICNQYFIHGPNDLPKIAPLGCFKSKRIFEVEAVICVKKGDMFVSDAIVKQGAWEEEIVHNAMKAVSLYKDAVFVDAGCNIGMYSIMVASMGRNVVAVDAMADNLAYIRASLELVQNADRAVLVHSPIRYIEPLDTL